MVEQISEFLKQGNNINIYFIGAIILFNIIKEIIILMKNEFSALNNDNKELLSPEDIVKGKRILKFHNILILLSRAIIWIVFCILLINLINFI